MLINLVAYKKQKLTLVYVCRSGNHLTLFTILLGLLELTRPLVFLAQHQSSLEDALACYMDMLDAFLYKRDSFIGMIDR